MTGKSNIVNRATPSKSAALFREQRYPNLINQQDEWLNWDGSAYQSIEDATICARVSEFLKACQTMKPVNGKLKAFPFDTRKSDIAEVVAALKNDVHKPRDTMAPPCWLDGTPPAYLALNPRNLISFQNGLLDIETRELYTATPFFFTRTALAIEYDELAPDPEMFLQFLGEAMKGRQPLVDLIQEMLGYMIATDTSMHKVFFLFGRPRSGKGTILRITTALVGVRNTCFPTIETLGAQFGMQGLIGKSVAQVTDMNTDDGKALRTTASRINGISGEDGVTVERKHISNWDGKLPTRFILAGNTLPNFGSHTNAMATRLLIVPFEVSFVGREDRSLTDKLMTELPGILNWALDGLDRLRARGDFAEPEDSAKAKHRLIFKSDPVHGFIAECCTVKPGTGVDKADLYAAFQRYGADTGARSLPPLKDFTEKLQELFPGVSASKRYIGERNKQRPCYRGVRFNDETALEIYASDPMMVDLGFTDGRALVRDAKGWPILKGVQPSDFEP